MTARPQINDTSLDTASNPGTLPSRAQRKAFVAVHPTRCGKYTLIAKIGHGGMAEVFVAVASGMAGFRKVAVVKRIHPQLLEEPDFVHMFLDEARLAARLSHPNVVLTNEVDEHDGVPFIAMEYMEGQAYDKVLKSLRLERTVLPVKTAVRITMDSLAGLHYAHELKDYDGSPIGVVHRDISPSNIFITYQGVVKILDFGIAKATTKLSETRTGQIKGKLAYMSPEQARGKRVDRRADIWSMGVTLFETCTGVRLFKGDSDIDTLQRVLNGDVSAMLAEDWDLPGPLLAVIRKSLARDPDERYSTAGEMRRALEEILPSLDGPDPELADFLGEHFAVAAESQREALGELLENASRLEPSMADDLRSSGEVSVTRPSIPSLTSQQISAARVPESRMVQQRTMLLALVGLLALAILAGTTVALLTGSKGEDASVPPTTPAPTTSAATTSAATTPPDPTPSNAPASAAVVDPAQAVEPGPTASSAAQRPAASPEPAGSGSRSDSASDRPRGALSKRRGGAPAPGSAPEAPRPEERPPQAPVEYGTLRLQTNPWSEVFLGSQRLGTTPLQNVRLPAGRHTLLLRNPEANLERRVPVTIEPDQITVLSFGL